MIEKQQETRRIRGSVRYGRVVPLGPYRTVRVEWEVEFFLDETTPEKVTLELEERMRSMFRDAGIV